MTIFRYDKTFEGLLTALFDAYSRKTFPEKLISGNGQLPLFITGIHDVITDNEKSGRVWKALEKKTSKQVCNMVVRVWLSELEESDDLIFRYMRKIFDSQQAVYMNFGDADVIEVQKIARKVSSEGEHIRQFVRFQKTSDGSYFAPVAPKFNALPLAVNYFTDRFADQVWLVYDTKRKYGYYYDLKKAVEVTLKDDEHLVTGKLNDELIADDEKLFQELWKGYFKALTIKERLNLKLQRQHMPRRFWKYLTEKQ